MARFLVRNPQKSRLELIVDVVEEADDEALARVRHDMHLKGSASGIVVDAAEMIVLRNTFDSLEEAAIREDFRLATQDLLSGVGSLPHQVEVWLERVRVNWRVAVPAKESVAKLLYDVIPALAGGDIERSEPTAA